MKFWEMNFEHDQIDSVRNFLADKISVDLFEKLSAINNDRWCALSVGFLNDCLKLTEKPEEKQAIKEAIEMYETKYSIDCREFRPWTLAAAHIYGCLVPYTTQDKTFHIIKAAADMVHAVWIGHAEKAVEAIEEWVKGTGESYGSIAGRLIEASANG